MIKLHLGCGSVYLDDFINIDVDRPGMFLSSVRPDLVDQNKTTMDNYYKNSMDINTINDKVVGVCDVYADISDLKYSLSSVDEIVCIHALEHLPFSKVFSTLGRWSNILKPGGLLTVAVPDIETTLDLYKEEQDKDKSLFLRRHIIGSRKYENAIHLSNFTWGRLSLLLTDYGFCDIEEVENKNFYPSIWFRCRKKEAPVTAEDFLILLGLELNFPSDWRILSVGCGKNIIKGVTDYLDIDPSLRDQIPAEFNFIHHDIMTRTEWPDKYFDFVFANSVLEHLESPELAIEEINRIGKAGFINSPTPICDFLLQYGSIHLWDVTMEDSGLIFRKKSPVTINASSSVAMQSAVFKIIKEYGYDLDHNMIAIRNGFWDGLGVLYNAYRWEDKIKYKIFR